MTTKELRGLAIWLRAAAKARHKVELAESTAVQLADALEALLPVESKAA